MTKVGKVTSCFLDGGDAHVGILIPCCTPAEVRAHSDPAVSHETARQSRHVTFDYMMDKRPYFQGADNRAYWTPESQTDCFPILGVDAAEVHALCVRVSLAGPYNAIPLRFNALLGGWCPCHTWCSTTPEVGPSTCVALTMRVVAAARSGSDAPLVDDEAAFRALDIPAGECCGPQVLTAYTPEAAVAAMRAAQVVGQGVGELDAAIATCAGRSPLETGARPLPALMLRPQ
jgi:hypothetical protein